MAGTDAVLDGVAELEERLVRYCRIDTESCSTSDTTPSTANGAAPNSTGQVAQP